MIITSCKISAGSSVGCGQPTGKLANTPGWDSLLQRLIHINMSLLTACFTQPCHGTTVTHS
jgi:hypothetical protein